MTEAKHRADPGETGRYRHLPPAVDLEDTVATKSASPVQDPERGRDTDREFMLRNAAG